MIVYCSDENCIHNNDGLCENKWPKGTEAIALEQTLSGQMICTDQKDRDEEEHNEGQS